MDESFNKTFEVGTYRLWLIELVEPRREKFLFSGGEKDANEKAKELGNQYSSVVTLKEVHGFKTHRGKMIR